MAFICLRSDKIAPWQKEIKLWLIAVLAARNLMETSGNLAVIRAFRHKWAVLSVRHAHKT